MNLNGYVRYELKKIYKKIAAYFFIRYIERS